MAPDPGDYERLRAMALEVDPGQIGIDPDDAGTAPWFAMIEFGFPEATVTIVAFADGSTSLYASNGFGVIGGGAHDSVVEANLRFRDAVGAALPLFRPVGEHPLPATGAIGIAARTSESRFGASAPERDILQAGHPLNPVFRAGNELFTALRLIAEAPDERGT